VWQEVQTAIHQVLNNTTLHDLCERTTAVRHRVVRISNLALDESAPAAQLANTNTNQEGV
jgi:DNA-binding IscR family transcriptional regulator